MNQKRKRILWIFPCTCLVFFGLSLLYHMTHRGHPPISVGECLSLASFAAIRFLFCTPTGIIIFLGFIIWFIASSEKHRRHR